MTRIAPTSDTERPKPASTAVSAPARPMASTVGIAPARLAPLTSKSSPYSRHTPAMEAYTLADRGTWLSFGNRQGLRVLVEGGRALINVYSVIPAKAAAQPAEAQALADRLLSAEGQTAIAGYTVGGARLFHPNADPLP